MLKKEEKQICSHVLKLNLSLTVTINEQKVESILSLHPLPITHPPITDPLVHSYT